MMNKIKKISLVFALLIIVSASLFGQTKAPNAEEMKKNSAGKEFWLCFMKNYKDAEKKSAENNLHLELFITGDQAATVNIEIKSIGFKKTVTLPAGAIKNIQIDNLAQVRGYEVIEQQHAVHITSDNPISVYGLNRRFQTTDTYMGLPVEALGYEYRVMSYSRTEVLLSEFAVVATENNTEVEITPTVFTMNGRPAGAPYKIVLNKGDVYQVAGRIEQDMKLRSDLTGTLVKSNKKISVFGGHQCAYVPAGPPMIMACNHLAEQIPPVPAWGKHFYIGKLKSRSKYTYRVVAHWPNTKVFEDNQLITILKPGEFIERVSARNIQVTGDKPILVAQFSQGFKNGDSIGDPMMILISPTQQFLKKYRFATPVNGDWEHMVNVIVPTKAIKTLKLDGVTVDSNKFNTLGISRYSIAYLGVQYGAHTLECDLPFGMYSYGFGFDDDAFDAYGNLGGQSFTDYEPAKDTIPPVAEGKQNSKKFNLILRDDGLDDTGIKDFLVIENTGLEAVVPNFTEGLPQLSVEVKPQGAPEKGKLKFSVTDVALNINVYTICYVYSEKAGDYVFYLNEGNEADCAVDPGFFVGAFGKMSLNFTHANFSKSGDFSTKGKFSSATGGSGYFGLSLTRKIMPKWSATIKMSLEDFGGKITAPDTVFTSVRNQTTGELMKLQESTDLTLDGLYSDISLGAEYSLNQNLYLCGGANVSLLLGKQITVNRNVVSPEFFTYTDGSRSKKLATAPKEMESLNSLGLSAFLGMGATYRVYGNYYANAEVNYSYSLTDLAKDTDWYNNKLSFMLGIRWRI